jgi:hypothetical protein
VARDGDRPCPHPALPDAPVALCERHALEVADWVGRDAGVTDVLPAPCLACGSRLGVHYASGWLCAVCEWRYGEVPDADALPVRVDVVYYIRFRDRIKIGTSANPRQRLAALPVDELLAFERGDRLVEHRRHSQFASSRLGSGEWFAPDAELMEHIAGLSAGVEDPWDRYARWVSSAIALGRTSG